ncbi:hypothetical protein ACFCYC_29205 [Streptomyces sp. NPDC056402]|uniref:hypothetical protein n=1 Tax=Streptomyces sp. NPDC056402 TaxID=3345810 RepID=UPI0035DB5C97
MVTHPASLRGPSPRRRAGALITLITLTSTVLGVRLQLVNGADLLLTADARTLVLGTVTPGIRAALGRARTPQNGIVRRLPGRTVTALARGPGRLGPPRVLPGLSVVRHRVLP